MQRAIAKNRSDSEKRRSTSRGRYKKIRKPEAFNTSDSSLSSDSSDSEHSSIKGRSRSTGKTTPSRKIRDHSPTREEREASYLSAEFNKRSGSAKSKSSSVWEENASSPITFDKWRERYLRMHTLYEESQNKIRELEHKNNVLEKELSEFKETGDIAQEKLKDLERLKAKFTVLETTTVQKHKQAISDLEAENKKLQQDVASAKLELDRVKDADSLIPHYRLAVMKVRAQVTTLTEKLDQQTSDNVSLRQEVDSLKSALQEAEAKNKSLFAQTQTLEDMRKMEQKETETTKKKLQQEIHELKTSHYNESFSEISRLKSELGLARETLERNKHLIDQLQSTISQQREDYNLHLQAALELATSEPIQVNLAQANETRKDEKGGKEDKTRKTGNVLPIPVNAASTKTPPTNNTKVPNKSSKRSPGTFRYDLEQIDSEIHELQMSIERASHKMHHS